MSNIKHASTVNTLFKQHIKIFRERTRHVRCKCTLYFLKLKDLKPEINNTKYQNDIYNELSTNSFYSCFTNLNTA